MGWVTLSSGEVVHTSIFDKNPVIRIQTMETKTTGNVTYVTQNYIHKDGTTQTVTLTYETVK